MDSYSVGTSRDAIASIANSMMDRSSIPNMSYTITMTSVAKMATIAICTIEGISISSNKGCRANLGKI